MDTTTCQELVHKTAALCGRKATKALLLKGWSGTVQQHPRCTQHAQVARRLDGAVEIIDLR